MSRGVAVLGFSFSKRFAHLINLLGCFFPPSFLLRSLQKGFSSPTFPSFPRDVSGGTDRQMDANPSFGL